VSVIDTGCMKLIDISRKLENISKEPGDLSPRMRLAHSMDRGESYNLTELTMCVHNGTHVDAPLHFIRDGRDVAHCPPEVFVGDCLVRAFADTLSADDIYALPENCRRLLIKGDVTVSEEAASAIVDRGIIMVGIERNAIGVPGDPVPVHVTLLGAQVGVLEGLDLTDAPEGEAFLMAQPLLLAGCEGAPCRALLMVNTGAQE